MPEFKVGEDVWAHTGTEASFDRGKVESALSHKKTYSVRIKTGVIEVKETDVHKVNAAAQDGLPDNTYLRELNEATLLHNVRTRYNDAQNDGGCYSVTGHILIAVNPFRKLAVYEESNVRGPPTHACSGRSTVGRHRRQRCRPCGAAPRRRR
jgi:myosin heavy subunit